MQPENVNDLILELTLTVFFVLLGLMNVVVYVNWCKSNVFEDLTEDKVKGAITSIEPKLSEKVLTAEEVVYMIKMKNNDYYMTCPTLSVYLYAGTDRADSYKKHSEYKQYFIEPQPEIEWDAYIDSWIANNLKGKIYLSDKFYINQRLWRDTDEPFMYGTGLSSRAMYPIECANTNNPDDLEEWRRYNPLVGYVPTSYIDRYYRQAYEQAVKDGMPNTDSMPYTKDMGYFYWTVEPYYE